MREKTRPVRQRHRVRFDGNAPAEADDGFRRDVLDGLSHVQKFLRPKYFYDKRGSELFDQITRLEEYYPTRTEVSIIREYIDEMADAVGPHATIIEYGSGSSIKTRFLLRALHDPAAYIPVDISSEHLIESAMALRRRFSTLPILPVTADYTKDFVLPELPEGSTRSVVFFPGSTIGNFEPIDARRFMIRMHRAVGHSGGVLIGVDLKKDPAVLTAAYDDAAGVTAAFNKNLLVRINRELDGDFDIELFDHRAVYNESLGRVEMHLVSRSDQKVQVDGRTFSFLKGEHIHTENSYKYNVAEFKALASEAGFRTTRTWVDNRGYFSVHYMVPEANRLS